MRRVLHTACAGWMMAAAALLQWPVSAAAAELAFQAKREGDWIVVSALADLPVAPALAWSVLSDYESYPRFISGMSESRIVLRTPHGVILEQRSEIGALFFVQRVETRMAVVETPPSTIVARSLAGSFQDLRGRYELRPLPGGVRLAYSGRFVPAFYLPPLFGMAFVRYSLEKHFSEMIDEILRRADRQRRNGS